MYKPAEQATNRENILRAALRLAERGGWSAVTLCRVAQEIAYAPPIIDQHFANKEAALQALMEQSFTELRNGVGWLGCAPFPAPAGPRPRLPAPRARTRPALRADARPERRRGEPRGPSHHPDHRGAAGMGGAGGGLPG
ncbi:TetR/AcrR family transcriptional regulator [Deinococcus hopiensis]|uniref:TetR/AcrR family transcriptional regulator n=1 Tax=Deinococcus hopiensis TaxID=309885 RepID=UPI000A00C37A|nr:helix-turn-helix domain-containing protein [Deinococcus hopiensis]